ncbi:hypothetical protein SAMN04488542_10570 [Fontibacillus panacisegetis]|uniref:Uncharacterized protein n=2 Tax=Fontibacillus panacisegetis TaxID=670482 RepID=A0A1G7HX13_9BACL|nr:hypothetical protein SAMN04488542_10570 [Fontibacillus panacisegetis]
MQTESYGEVARPPPNYGNLNAGQLRRYLNEMRKVDNMSNPQEIEKMKIEAQRLTALELLRTSENSHFIDAGIVSGEAAGDVALKIVNEAIEEEKSIEMMVEEAKRIIASRG